jgi:hypothetical protein
MQIILTRKSNDTKGPKKSEDLERLFIRIGCAIDCTKAKRGRRPENPPFR